MPGDAEKWDARYRDALRQGQLEKANPLAALLEYSYLLPSSGTALDLACGTAGNADYLLEQGLQVSAWDISSVVTQQLKKDFSAQGKTVDVQSRDIVNNPPATETFDVIVVARFLERTLAPAIMSALKPQGVLFYQTFVRDKAQNTGPSNPDFLLDAGELLQLFAALTPRVFFDLGTVGHTSLGLRNESLLIAQKMY